MILVETIYQLQDNESSSKLEYDETLLDEEDEVDDDEDERSWKR